MYELHAARQSARGAEYPGTLPTARGFLSYHSALTGVLFYTFKQPGTYKISLKVIDSNSQTWAEVSRPRICKAAHYQPRSTLNITLESGWMRTWWKHKESSTLR